jgi:hypothetical protein
MKNKRIWIGLGFALLIICLSLFFQISKENKLDESSKTTLPQAENIEITLTLDDVTDDIKDEIDESDDQKYVETTNDTDELDKIANSDTENSIDLDTNLNEDLLNPDSDVVDLKSEEETDDFNTDPVPEDKPLPVEWQDTKIEKDSELKCTLSVTCTTVLDNLDKLNEEKKDIIPEDGIIFEEQEVVFYEGETVFNVLLREMKKNKIHLEFSMAPLYNSNYIEGIGNLYELDCGELSGWIFKVNGWSPNYGSSRYKLSDGDKIQWQYTCDLGRDIGEESMNIEMEENQ